MWIDSFRARVETHPNRVAIVAQGRTTSYGDLWRRAAAVARGIPARGARHLISEADPQTALETVIGAWMAGKVPAMVAPDLSSEAVSQVAQRLAQPAPTQDDPALREALITTTSGSSGTPKLVVHPHRSLDTSFRYQQQLVGLPEYTQELISAGMHLSRALITNSLQGLYEGWTLHLFPGGTAGGVLQAHIRSHGIGMMAGPASFFRMFFRYGEDAVFPTFRYVRTSGEHTPWSVVEQMQVAFPEALVVLGYG
ncbi:MAG TPA: AMP-binding protein, partial [bacterium]